jgi:hypothetical protein
MLMLAGKIRHLRNLRLRHFVCIDPANADTFLMNMHHDPIGLLARLVEEPLEYVDDEIHRRVIVIEQEHLVKAGPLGFRLGLCNDPATLVCVIGMIWLSRHEYARFSRTTAPHAFAASFASVPHGSVAIMMPYAEDRPLPGLPEDWVPHPLISMRPRRKRPALSIASSEGQQKDPASVSHIICPTWPERRDDHSRSFSSKKNCDHGGLKVKLKIKFYRICLIAM